MGTHRRQSTGALLPRHAARPTPPRAVRGVLRARDACHRQHSRPFTSEGLPMLGQLWRRLKLFFGLDRATQNLEEEMRLHRELRAEQLRAQGVQDPDAEARRQFGNATRIAERSRDAWVWPGLDALVQDAKVTLRALRRNPAFTAGVMATFALGVGANAAMFSLIDRMMFRPPAR